MSFFDESFSDVSTTSTSKTKKKKSKANGFLMFLLEFRRKEQKNGNVMDMAEAQYQAGEIWKNMTAKDREKYTERSAQDVNREPQKFTSCGVSFDEMDRQKKLQLQTVKNMELSIQEMLQTAAEKDCLKSLTFNFFSSSYFCQCLNGDIYPAEIAMAKFNLDDGVIDTLHTAVNPGQLPMGQAADAMLHGKSTHQYDLPPNIDGETDYAFILGEIKKFIGWKSGKKNPPIFVNSGFKDEDFKVAKMTLAQIVRNAGEEGLEFDVYPMEHLVWRLQKMCIMYYQNVTSKPFASLIMTKDLLVADTFMYSDIGCDFHIEKDCSQHCCLSKVKRWGYMIVKFCLDTENDQMIPGQHFPETVEIPDQVKSSSFSEASEKDWENITDSLKSMRLDSKSTMSLASRSVKDSSFDISVDSIHTVDRTVDNSYPPSTVDNASLHESFSEAAELNSYAAMLRAARNKKGGISK